MTIPELFQKLPAIHASLDGWCDLEKAMALASIVVAQRPTYCLEIGLFGGKSFIPIALAQRVANPQGISIGIDPWSKEVALREQTTEKDREWWDKNIDMEQVYQKFMAAISHYGLSHACRIERRESKDVQPPGYVELLHVDGSHAQTAYDDMVRFAPHVIIGGYCVTDDSQWTGGGVSRGEQWLMDHSFRRLYSLGTGAVFQRVK